MVYPTPFRFLLFFFFNATPTTEIYTLSLHDALPISVKLGRNGLEEIVQIKLEADEAAALQHTADAVKELVDKLKTPRSEEHTSELQSRLHLVCRLLLEKKKKKETQIQLSLITSTHPA